MNFLKEIDIVNDLLPIEKKLETEKQQAQKAQEILRLFRANQKIPIIHLQDISGNMITPRTHDFSDNNPSRSSKIGLKK